MSRLKTSVLRTALVLFIAAPFASALSCDAPVIPTCRPPKCIVNLN
ncbi:hypothetical protein [Deinococcus multiflagellatus]|uniref:Uncharacterized protein n=1 Tax=Deinococcus multiflagellatus TaxID=1656887 RepID=A0ABW1ZFJ6_9DEIO|nr:hypothetical protein [Deinococcus multiflagellatus]MBZ9712968.1 hypothetical protein [Deinococcus multiflagellatus]